MAQTVKRKWGKTGVGELGYEELRTLIAKQFEQSGYEISVRRLVRECD